MTYIITLFESDITIFNLYDIFKLIVILCSKAQGIETFKENYNYSDEFIRFCTQFDMSDTEGKRGWQIVRHRIKNYRLIDDDLDLSKYEELESTSGWTRAACVVYYLAEIKNNKYSNNNVKDK